MKKNIIFAAFAAASALLLVSSCAKEELSESNIAGTSTGKTFSASIEQGLSKSTITYDTETQKSKVNWESTDQVSINGAVYSVTPKSDDPTKADLTYVSGTAPESPYKAIFPASLYVTDHFEFPATQTYAEGKFNAPMYAESSTESLSFKNICGVLCLSLKGTDKVKSISVTANEPICGAFTMTDATTGSLTGTGKTVVLNCGEAQLSESDATDFYIYLPPATYTAGMEIVVMNTDYHVFKKTTTTAAEIARNNIYTFNWTADFVAQEPEYVKIADVGVLWAKMNLGASTVGGSYSTCTGDYLQYGAETTLYNSITWDGSSATFNWKDGKSGGFTKGNGTYLSKAITEDTDFVLQKAIGNGWRTPTIDDFKSLINACGGTNGTATPNPLNSSDPEKGVYWLAADQDYLAEYKGVAGVLFVDGNKTKLFFPTTGYGKGTSLTNGTEGRYWTRDYDSGGLCCRLTSQAVKCANAYKLNNYYGAPIRPVKTSTVILSRTKLDLYPYVGASATLTATAIPESAVTWTSSNVNVVSVSNDGVITVKGEGTATITASTADGREATCAVSVAPEPEYIEMAGIKWATKNLGATKIAGSYATCAGDFYQWGSIETLYESITWNGNSPQITWKSGKSAGYIDNNREYKETPETLPDDRDVVKMKIKDGWSMPTNDDFKALYQACGGTGTGSSPTSGGSIITNSKGRYYCENYYGVPGVLFCDGKNTLFFPETGSLNGKTHLDESYSWTPSFYENRSGSDYAYCAHIDHTHVSPKMYLECYRGFSIRPVKK